MAKKEKAIVQEQVAEVVATATEAATKTEFGKRGLKGVPIEAKIIMLTSVNPKRKGCQAEARFALYKDGMTQAEFLDAGGTTPDLAYDTAHGFIAVEGYTPPKTFAPKAPKEPKAKVEKAPRAKKVKSQEQVAAESELDAVTTEETID